MVQRVGSSDGLVVVARRELVARIASSDLFLKAPRLREFLLYAAECTLENRLSEVREQVIAERVFSRKPDFQGTQDTIVRAEARNLRKRLETYFATEGRNETMVVSMPKGGYALAFEPRLEDVSLPAPLPGIEAPAIASPLSLTKVSELPEVLRSSPLVGKRAAWLLAAVCMMFAIVATSLAIYFHEDELQFEQRLHVSPAALPFSALFAQGRDSLIVTSDTGFLQIAELAHRPLSLDEYIARSYPNMPAVNPSDLIRNWNLYEFTDGREMSVAGLILHNYPQFAGRTTLRSGHEVSLDDFKTHTAVLIGSPVSNPWAQLFEERLNFVCEFDRSGRILFRDRAAGSSIASQYPNLDDMKHNRTYARLAFLPGSNDAPAALLIAGTTAQSTKAAGELVADRVRFGRTLRKIGISPAGPPHFFEILLRSTVFVGGSTAPEVVAWRLTPPREE